MNKEIFLKVACTLILQPKLIFTIIKNKLKIKDKAQKKNTQTELSNEKNNRKITLRTKRDLSVPIVRLTGIAVIKEYSGLGVGSNLVKAFEKEAKMSNYSCAVLKTPMWNKTAIRLYENNGWEQYIEAGTESNNFNFFKTL